MQQHYFATGYIRLLYRFVRTEGVSEASLLAGTGCAEAQLMQADFEMPFDAQMRLCANALEHTSPGLGLRVGHQLQLAAHGTLGNAMQSAPNLETALTAFCRFVAARASFFHLELHGQETPAKVLVQIDHIAAELRPFFAESVLFSLVHCLSFYAAHDQPLLQCAFAHAAPSYANEYPKVFGVTPDFDQQYMCITFDRLLLSLASPEADPEVYQQSVRRCQNQLHNRRDALDLVAEIRYFLIDNPGKLWRLEEVASWLGLGSRTLIRRLRAEGTSFQSLRDEVLQQLAANYLMSMTAEATGIALGFADTASFRRTFKRWYGITPSAFNKQT